MKEPVLWGWLALALGIGLVAALRVWDLPTVYVDVSTERPVGCMTVEMDAPAAWGDARCEGLKIYETVWVAPEWSPR